MNILITGSSGLVGSALVPFLNSHGHQVTALVRRAPQPLVKEIQWNPDTGTLDVSAMEGFDAVIHLAGENIGAGRWTRRRKRSILDSRLKGTNLLVHALGRLQRPPQVMVSASAVGYYGSRGAEILREESGAGAGFLADVCREWERAAAPTLERGIRLVILRMGMILTRAGGVLARLLPPFRLGLGAKLGSGSQFVSWIALDDLLQIVDFALGSPSVIGALNAVAPQAVTNLEFTHAMGKVLRRPTLFAVPAAAIKLMFGEMGEQLLLSSSRVVPARLIESGFRFRYPELEPALRHLLSASVTHREPAKE